MRKGSALIEAEKLLFLQILALLTFGLIRIPQNVTLTGLRVLTVARNSPDDCELEGKMSLLMTVPPNLVQSIRASASWNCRRKRPPGPALPVRALRRYADQAAGLRPHRRELSPSPASAARISMRCVIADQTIAEAGPQPGFIVVLEQLPNTQKFDKEARETLLDVFRDAAEFWAEKKVPFRVFYSFEEPQSRSRWVGLGRGL
jgi:hypothetical protein